MVDFLILVENAVENDMFDVVKSKDTEDFWAQYPELCWSNRQASDLIHIRAALCRPKFDCLLNIAHAFGLKKLQSEWATLCSRADPSPEVERARPVVERILQNIEEGFRRAAS